MVAPRGAEERAFRHHVERPEFLLGVIKGQWRLIRIDWPNACIAVTARDGTEWGFAFQLDGYPSSLPNGRPCELPTGHPLPPQRWPQGTGRVAAVFNPRWNAGALYLPCDRLALPGHHQWVTEHPALLWKPARGIIHYLEIIHDLLSSYAYQPPVRPAA